MRTKAAVLFEQPSEWQIVDAQLDPPRSHEVLVRLVASGLCHSDDHNATGDSFVPRFPFCGGHEAAGVIEEVGPDVAGLEVGDHIVTSFIPSCGRCRWCATGQQNLCDDGRFIRLGSQLDGTYRMHVDGVGVGQSCLVGAFSEYSVMPEHSCIKIPADVPLTSAALLGCAVPTGWGSAVYGARVAPGDIVVVLGVGGIGINAVQGAGYVGAEHVIAVDPVALKRDMALKLGATEAFDSVAEAGEFARSISNGRGADSAIVTIGVVRPSDLADAFGVVGKSGTVVLAGLGNDTDAVMPLSLRELSTYQKRIQGSLYGGLSPVRAVPLLLSLYRNKHLRLDELVSRTYRLDEINQGYADLHAGLNVRGLIDFAS